MQGDERVDGVINRDCKMILIHRTCGARGKIVASDWITEGCQEQHTAGRVPGDKGGSNWCQKVRGRMVACDRFIEGARSSAPSGKRLKMVVVGGSWSQ